MLTKSGFIKPTRWLLVRDQPSETDVWKWNVLKGRAVNPRTCSHPKPTFNGTIWFCQTCGEPIRDGEERRQSEIDLDAEWDTTLYQK